MTGNNEQKLSDFIKDWRIDVQNRAASHKSGLSMRWVKDNADGTFRFEVANLPLWEAQQRRLNKDAKAIRDMETDLVNQFGMLYLKKIKPLYKNLAARRRQTALSR